MTTAYLLADLQQDEGCELRAYPDPGTRSDPWTIGYGHTGPEVHPGLIWTMAQALAALAADVGKVKQGLDSALPWWRTLNAARQDVLVNMAFNMGVHGLLGFHNTLDAIQAQNWTRAAQGMLSSAWASQVGARADRLALQMQTGLRAS